MSQSHEITPYVPPALPAASPAVPFVKKVSASVSDPAFDFNELLRACRRRWLLCLLVGLLLGIAGTAAAWVLMPITTKYTARTLLQVSSRAPKIVFDAESQPDFGSYQRTTIALIKSRLVLQAALKQPGILQLPTMKQLQDPITWLEKNILADFSIGPEILRIALNGENQEEITQIVEAVRDSYLSEVVDKEKNRRRDRLQEIENLWKRYDDTLRDKRAKLRKLAETVGSGEAKVIAIKQQTSLETLAALEKEFFSIGADKRRQRVELSSLEAKLKASAESPVSDALIEDTLKKDIVHQQLLAKLLQARQVLQEAESRVGKDSNNAALKRYQTDVQMAEKELDDRRKELKPQIIKQQQEAIKQELIASLTQVKERISKLEELEKQVETDVKRLREEGQNLNKKALDLESEKKEIESMETIQTELNRRKDMLKLELEAPSRVNQLEDVILQQNFSKKGPILIALVGFGAGLLGLLAVGYWEYSRRRVYSPEQVVSTAHLPLIGTLPIIPERLRMTMNQGNMPSFATGQKRDFLSNIYKESIDTARSFLLHATRTGEASVIMVTSALSGEGKTTLASSLASSMARSGKSTLLMECDLRRPMAHMLLNLPGYPGICEVLRKETKLSQVVQRCEQPHLFFLPAGQLNEGAMAMLSMDGMRRLFRVLRKRFEIIIVDTAPVLPVADTLLISKHVDAAIFSVLKDVSRMPKVVAAQERLNSLGVRILGAVVSCNEQASYKSSYHYYGTYQPKRTAGNKPQSQE
jgi:succinoglycan biosynthesis transport protein ExoP